MDSGVFGYFCCCFVIVEDGCVKDFILTMDFKYFRSIVIMIHGEYVDLKKP